MRAGSRIVTVVERAERWIYRPGTARHLTALRVGLCLVLAARLSRPLYLQLAGQPRALFRPVSFMHLLPSMPPAGLVLTIQVVAVVAALLAAGGIAARVTLPAAWLGAVFLNGMWTSVGKIMHNDTLLILALVPLLVAPVADAWRVTGRRPDRRAEGPSVRYGWPVRTAMIVVAGGYFFTGLAKVVFSGPAWVLSDNLRWVMFGVSDQGQHPIGAALLLAGHPLLAHAVAAAALLAELTFPVALWKPAAGWILVPAVVLLHAGIGLTMHLDYSAWALTTVVVFVPWDAVAERRTRGRVRPVTDAVAVPG